MSDKTILLVEDNDDDAELTLRALNKHKLATRIVRARDGIEALELLHGPSPLRPDLMLIDLNMPRLDGIGLLRKVRAQPTTRSLPIVILTSSNEDRDVIEGYRLGANSYVRKPVDFLTFSDAVKALGLYWLELNLAPR
jgi:two-component system, response regulator